MPNPIIPQLLPRFVTQLHFTSLHLKWVSTTVSNISSTSTDTHLQPSFRGFIKNSQNSDHELALVSALKSCASLQSLSDGRKLHSLVLKSGLALNIFIHNSLLSMYAKCGIFAAVQNMFNAGPIMDSVSCNIMLAAYVKFNFLDDAHQLFDKMPVKGCVSYTTMIMGFSQSGHWVEAVRLFEAMRQANVTPNEVTLASVISSYSHLGMFWSSRLLHGLTTKLGLEETVLVSTNLVHIYCLSSGLLEARELFNSMPERNLVSWNAMLNGYAKAGLVDLARKLFDEIPLKDVVSWGTMIDGCVQAKLLAEALSLYCSMLSTGILPNYVMIVDLISCCGRMGVFEAGLQLHCTIIIRGFINFDFVQATIIYFCGACCRIDLAEKQFECSIKNHITSQNALLTAYVRSGMIQQARVLFDEMPERDVFSWSAMISGYAQSENSETTLHLFRLMVDSAVRPNEITMVSVFSAIAGLGMLQEGKLAHEYILQNSIPLNDNLIAALIDMYAKCGSVKDALDLFYNVRKSVLSVSPWNAIICGLAMHGHAHLSLMVFQDLLKKRIALNSITFIGVLTACCHAGLVEDGERYFKSMKSVHNVEPDLKHYGCMVDLLGRSGRLADSEELIRSMPMKPDVVIWGTLLSACRKHGNVEMGERAAQNLGRLDTCHGAGRVLLSNIYADAGRWEDAVWIRKTIQMNQMHRSPGYSEVI